MIQFFRNYFTDAYYLLTFRHKSRLRVGSSTAVYLFSIASAVGINVLNDYLHHWPLMWGSMIMASVMLLLAWCWRNQGRDMFVAYAMVGVFTLVAGMLAEWATGLPWVAAFFNVGWFLFALLRYDGPRCDPEEPSCPSN